MRHFLYSICLLLLAGTLAAAQTAATAAPVPAKSLRHRVHWPAQRETTVDSFLHQQFGYRPI